MGGVEGLENLKNGELEVNLQNCDTGPVVFTPSPTSSLSSTLKNIYIKYTILLSIQNKMRDLIHWHLVNLQCCTTFPHNADEPENSCR